MVLDVWVITVTKYVIKAVQSVFDLILTAYFSLVKDWLLHKNVYSLNNISNKFRYLLITIVFC